VTTATSGVAHFGQEPGALLTDEHARRCVGFRTGDGPEKSCRSSTGDENRKRFTHDRENLSLPVTSHERKGNPEVLPSICFFDPLQTELRPGAIPASPNAPRPRFARASPKCRFRALAVTSHDALGRWLAFDAHTLTAAPAWR